MTPTNQHPIPPRPTRYPQILPKRSTPPDSLPLVGRARGAACARCFARTKRALRPHACVAWPIRAPAWGVNLDPRQLTRRARAGRPSRRWRRPRPVKSPRQPAPTDANAVGLASAALGTSDILFIFIIASFTRCLNTFLSSSLILLTILTSRN